MCELFAAGTVFKTIYKLCIRCGIEYIPAFGFAAVAGTFKFKCLLVVGVYLN